MSAVRDLIKGVANSFGYKIEKIDPLEELLPKKYNLSPFLPRVYRKALYRLLYFKVPHRGSVNPSPLGDGKVGRI
jgi:hypothetical protein